MVNEDGRKFKRLFILKNMAWKIFNILNGRQSEMLQSYFDIWSKLIWVKKPVANSESSQDFLRTHKLYYSFMSFKNARTAQLSSPLWHLHFARAWSF